MKSTIRRPLSFLLTLVLLCTLLAVPAGAATSTAQEAAQELYQLGLFQGTGTLPDGRPDFKLDDTATRGEAAVMLVRLLGGEQEALSSYYYHPFTDAGWAGSYLGYVYQKNITYGVGGTTFGVNVTITASEFLTMLLRAMGYSQVNWQNPYPTARAVGLNWSGSSDFRRGDMAYICQSALSCRLNGSGQTLLQRLESQGAIHAPGENQGTTYVPEPNQGFTPGPVTPTGAANCTVYSGLEAREKLLEAYNCRAEKLTMVCPIGVARECESMVKASGSFYADLKSISYSVTKSGQTQTIVVEPAYTDAVEIMAYLEGKRGGLSSDNTRTLEKARQVHDALVTPQMSEYDQVKAFHDYLVNNTTYGGSSDRRFTAGGALVDGVAVCDGYAMALDLLCYLSGIDCVRVTGYAGRENHAWNKVKINGNWYNIDVTWDDPVSSRPMLVYDYFLISDAAIGRDHTLDTNPYWPAAPASWPGR